MQQGWWDVVHNLAHFETLAAEKIEPKFVCQNRLPQSPVKAGTNEICQNPGCPKALVYIF